MKFSLEGNVAPSQLMEQPNPLNNKISPKFPIKKLKIVHINEVRNKGVIDSYRQDGGDVDHFYSNVVYDIDVSYDCELNLSTNFKPI